MTKSKQIKTTEYWHEETDPKKLVLFYLSKLWVIALGTIAGIVIGIAVYFIYHAIADGVSYEAYSQMYLDFAADETGEAYQYYNGYTWNELMTTDLIADNTLGNLSDKSIDLAKLEADTYAEIKSDIRVLRVTITDEDPDVCADIQAATEKALVSLGSEAKEFNSIEVIKSVPPARVYADDRLPQAILLGAIIGLLITLVCVWVYSILDDRICTPSDVYSLDKPLLGITLSQPEASPADKLSVLEWPLPSDADQQIRTVSVKQLLKAEAECEADPVILEIPYKSVSRRYVRMLITTLEDHGSEVKGIRITEADNKFYRLYL